MENFTIKDIEVGKEYVFIESDPDQSEDIKVLHCTCIYKDEYNPAGKLMMVKFTVREYPEGANEAFTYKIINNPYAKADIDDNLFEKLTWLDSNKDMDKEESAIYTYLHRWKSVNGGSRFYFPRGFMFGRTDDEAIQNYKNFLDLSLVEHQNKIDEEIRVLNLHKENFAKQINWLNIHKD